jgi:hypothetical protein
MSFLSKTKKLYGKYKKWDTERTANKMSSLKEKTKLAKLEGAYYRAKKNRDKYKPAPYTPSFDMSDPFGTMPARGKGKKKKGFDPFGPSF